MSAVIQHISMTDHCVYGASFRASGRFPNMVSVCRQSIYEWLQHEGSPDLGVMAGALPHEVRHGGALYSNQCSMRFDCFLSYASLDRVQAEGVYGRLVNAGFIVWFDAARLQPGYNWHKEIEDGCESSRVILALLTPNWKLSQWTRYETYGAEFVIPLVVEGGWEQIATPPLKRFQNIAIDLETSTESEWQRLFGSIREFCSREHPRKQDRLQSLPYRCTQFFVGREKDLNELHESLFIKPTTTLTQGGVQVLAEMGGIGKTALVRHYAEKFWRCYRQLFWVDCRRGLEIEFAAIHDILRPGREVASLLTREKAAWVRWEFDQSEKRPPRLLILDNAEDEESVSEWIPKTGTCHTLITSRFTAWSAGIGVYRVWVLEPEPARRLLLGRSGRSETPEEQAACDAVAKKLGYLPLALEQASAYVSQQPPGWGFPEYFELYEQNELKFLQRHASGATDYPTSVYLTWRATIDKLPSGARAILRLHTFIASTPTPVAMFVKGIDRVTEEIAILSTSTDSATNYQSGRAGEYEVREWVAALMNYSMAQPHPQDSFSVHALVHTVEWYEMGEDRFDALSRMTDVFTSWAPKPSWEPENQRVWDTLLPHAQRLIASAGLLTAVQTPALLAQVSAAYRERGRYREAIPLMRQCLVANEQAYGPEHPATLTAINNLAFFCKEGGERDEAQGLYLRALEASERVLGPDHPDTLVTINSLGDLMRAGGKYDEAEALCRRALDVRQKTLGPEDPATLTSINNLSSLLHITGQHHDAERLCRDALEVYERNHPGHPDTLKTISNLAALLMTRGRFDEAESLNRQTLEARRRILGDEHPDTLTSAANLAEVLRVRGKYAEAMLTCQSTLEARERLLGAEHPDTLTSQTQLALLLQATGSYADAEKLLRQVLDSAKRTLGDDHPETIAVVNSLALLTESRADYQEAEQLLRRALALQERIFGTGNVNTLANLNNLAGVLQSQGKIVEAEDLYRRALGISEGALGPEHPETVMIISNMATLIAENGDSGVAECLYGRALDGARRTLGPEHPRTLATINNLANLLEKGGDRERAEQLYRQAFEGSVRASGAEHPNTLTFANNLGWLVFSKGDLDEAESLLRPALSARERVLGLDHPETLKNLSRLAEVLETRDRDGAASLRVEHTRRSLGKNRSS